MNRTEFLETLRSQLLSEMQPAQAADQVNYYDNYIREQVASGSREEDVLAGLGDPRLIAKTILSTGAAKNGGGNSSYNGSTYEEHSEQERSGYPKRRRLFANMDLSTWYGKALVIAVAALILFLLITILSALIPFILIFFFILFIISQIKKRR